eukprot:3197802-Prymnesium_polylepis.2
MTVLLGSLRLLLGECAALRSLPRSRPASCEPPVGCCSSSVGGSGATGSMKKFHVAVSLVALWRAEGEDVLRMDTARGGLGPSSDGPAATKSLMALRRAEGEGILREAAARG